MKDEVLERVRAARANQAATHAAFVASVRAAHAAGASLREIAAACEISHTQVRNIVHGLKTGTSGARFPGSDELYRRLHQRVARLRGRPQRCERCGREGPGTVYDWANLTGLYEDVDDYERMCRRCHKAYDRQRG